MLDAAPAPTSVLAFLTTVHLALVVLRAHRSAASGPVNLVSAISLLFSGSPWLLSSPLGLAVGFLAHGAWFSACERLLPTAGTPAPVMRPPPVVRRSPGIAQMARTPKDFVPAAVVAVFDETPDIRTFRMVRPEGFEFKAGQFLTVRLRADGREYVRCYSISSPPGSRGHMEITVKRIGLVSGALHAVTRPGTMLHVRPPAGAFVYPAGEDRPLVFIAGGVGITPIMSMLRHAIEEEPTRPATLLYSVRTMEDIAFRDEILMLDRRHAHFRAFIAITDGPAADGFFPGRINESLIATTVPDVGHAICLMCGPQPMLDAMTATLTGIGVPRGQIHYEIFQAAVAASSAQPKGEAPAPDPGDSHQVTFKRSGLSATVATSQRLLDVAESCGAGIPSLCRAGVCGTCRTRVLSGKVHCASHVLDEQDRRDGIVLACVSEVLGDCAIDA